MAILIRKMRVHPFFHLIRGFNLVLVMIMQIIMYYGYIIPQCSADSYHHLSFLLLLAGTALIAAGGNIFNDLRDIDADKLHPRKKVILTEEIKVSTAKKWYYITNLTAVAGGALIAWITGTWTVLILFASTIILLYLYSIRLKNTILIGNITIAFLCALSVYIPVTLFHDCTLSSHIAIDAPSSLIFYGYIINSFFILLLREIIKDKEDAPSDQMTGIKTTGSLNYFQTSLLVYGLIIFLMMVNGYGIYLLFPFFSLIQILIGGVILFLPLIYMASIFPDQYKNHYFWRLSLILKIYILLAAFLLLLWIW